MSDLEKVVQEFYDLSLTDSNFAEICARITHSQEAGSDDYESLMMEAFDYLDKKYAKRMKELVFKPEERPHEDK